MTGRLTSIPLETKYADILLIYPDFAKNSLGMPSYHENHLGLNRLASYLDAKGYSVKILNTTGLPEGTGGPDMLAEYLKENRDGFNVLGFHLNSWNVSHVMKTLGLVSKKFKDRLILFGGPLPTSEPQKVLELFKSLGFTNLGLVQGYGELVLEKIMQKLRNLEEVEGVWSLQNRKIQPGKLQRLSSGEMAELPFLNPKYNTFYQLWYKPYTEENGEKEHSIDTIFSAQGLDVNHGCPFNCSYCSVHIFGHSISEYTPLRAVEELQKLAEETGFFMFTYTNSNLMFVRRNWIIEFCNLILERKMDHYVSWSGYHHPNTLNLLSVEDFKLMKRAGCDQIVVGIQSVEPKILRLFNRHVNTYQHFKLIREKTAAADLELVIDYIRGVPGEDLDIVNEFYDYCIKNGVEVREFLLKIYPNTDLQKKSLDLTNYELIPITGNLAPELDSYAVVPKFDEPRNRLMSLKLNNSNDLIRRKRKIRLGCRYLETASQAEKLKDTVIPGDEFIPSKVKNAMVKMLNSMLNPTSKTKGKGMEAGMPTGDPARMMKALVMADETAPPMVREMQKRLKAELGEEKFEMLKRKYSQEDLPER